MNIFEAFYTDFIMKAPDGGCMAGCVYTHVHTDIGRASLYEYVGQ